MVVFTGKVSGTQPEVFRMTIPENDFRLRRLTPHS